MFRLALGLTAVRGTAGTQTAYEYEMLGKEWGGKCSEGSQAVDLPASSTSEQWDCESRCNEWANCSYYSIRKSDFACVFGDKCTQAAVAGESWNSYKKGDKKDEWKTADWTEPPSTTVVSTTVTHITTTLVPLDPLADMTTDPIRRTDLPKGTKTNNLSAKLAGKSDPAVANLIQAMCPGAINIENDGQAFLVNTVWNLGDDHAGQVKVEEGRVAPYMSGRTYFAEACTAGMYNHNEYLAYNLLGKEFAFTVDLTGAGCGCNAALYLTNLRQNSNVSECQDFYCDANNVCGESCAEVDIMEANQHAWHSTLHTATDRDGAAVGYGGGGPGWSGPRDWTNTDYGPNGRCVDTLKPFKASIRFPVNRQGILRAMDVVLSQKDMPCTMTLSLDKYEGMEQMSEAFKAGMTPIISYWAADDMTWMDGAGDDMQGPCIKDNATTCGDKVQMYDFKITKLKNSYLSPKINKPITTTPSPEKKKAVKAQLAKELKAQQKEQGTEENQEGDWNEQGDQGQEQQGDWNNQGQQQEGEKKEGDSWGEPWADWDHARPQAGQVWDGEGRPVEQDGQSTTTTPCQDPDPVHCRPKLPGDPNRDGLKDDDKKAETDADYLFKKNEALGPLFRVRGSAHGVHSTVLVAGFAVLLAMLAVVMTRRRRAAPWEAPRAAPDVATGSEGNPQRAVSLLRAAPSSQSLLTLSPQEAV